MAAPTPRLQSANAMQCRLGEALLARICNVSNVTRRGRRRRNRLCTSRAIAVACESYGP
jgi:hypothetical protein